MLSKRIIVCLDVRAGKLTKGVKFLGNVDIGDPVPAAQAYYEQGVDEIVFYDITASAEGRGIMLDVVREVARTIFIPFSVGGGLCSLADMQAVIAAGAEKVSLNSGAIAEPQLISQGARAFGSQCIVLGMDVKKVAVSDRIPSGYEIVSHGGRKFTNIDALWWAQEGERLGAGEICLNSIDADGTQTGYEIALTKLISSHVGIPVIASGGAGKPEHLVEVLREGGAAAALIASIVHYKMHSLKEIKECLHAANIKTRLSW